MLHVHIYEHQQSTEHWNFWKQHSTCIMCIHMCIRMYCTKCTYVSCWLLPYNCLHYVLLRTTTPCRDVVYEHTTVRTYIHHCLQSLDSIYVHEAWRCHGNRSITAQHMSPPLSITHHPLHAVLTCLACADNSAVSAALSTPLSYSGGRTAQTYVRT